MAQKKPVHILRYGTVAEKVHLEKAVSAYDYLSINGNTAAYVSSAIAKFVVAKFFSRPEKGFFIDPITYAFQNEIRLLRTTSKATGEESIKKSVQKLMEIYGSPMTKVVTGKPVSVDDFKDEAVKAGLCERVISFQYNLVYDHISSNDLQKYLDYVSPDQSKNLLQLRPKFLIAPYFYLDIKDPLWESWMKINISFAEIAKKLSEEHYNNTPIFAQIVLSKDMLRDSTAVFKIIAAYQALNCDGYTIWIDELCEHEADYVDLYGFMKLLKGLHGKTVYNMYGGFFSILLTHKSIGLLSGVSHGLEYGESRKVYPVGGGIPVSKYYFFPVHQRLDFTKAFYLLESDGVIDTSRQDWGSPNKYYSDICKCSQCKDVIKNEMINFMEFESREFYEVHRNDQIMRRKKASTDTKENCLYHYLLCKKVEFSLVWNNKLSIIISQLEDAFTRFSTCDALKRGELDYIRTWCNLLQSSEWGVRNGT